VDLDPALTIAPLTEDDLEDVLRLERVCFADPWSRQAFRQELRSARQGGYSRVVREAGELHGYSIAWFVADEGHLANLAVAPEHRRRGLARHLLEDFIEEARGRASRILWLEVRVSNLAAIRLYERYRFRSVGVRKGYYSMEREDALVMCLDLAPQGEDKSGLVHEERRSPSTGQT
jgi:[ribosomal protein S18]-alanine N-acetyltransferase